MLDYDDHDAAAMHADWNDATTQRTAQAAFYRVGLWLVATSHGWDVIGPATLLSFPAVGDAMQWLRSRQDSHDVLE